MISTGSVPFDKLLGGGLRPADRMLVYGPSYQGKEIMVHQTMRSVLDQKTPVVIVLTNTTLDDMMMALEAVGCKTDDKLGSTLFVIDCFSRSVEADVRKKGVVYLDSPTDSNAIAVALNAIQGKLTSHPQHLLVIDSVSTLILYGSAQSTFRFLQVAVGRARRSGATTLMLMDEGLHQDAEVQMFRHMCDGSVEFRSDKEKPELRVQGLANVQNKTWIEYEATEKGFSIVGSLAAGRIK